MSLAIVIPAYKNEFLDETLNSLRNQSNKNFTLYIGDDCSPFDLALIINTYRNDLNIVYKKFSNNIGKTNLVAQWTRCISMIDNEKWIWLFSDDDLLEQNCVESFYTYLHKYPNEKLFHFDTSIIDKDSKVIKRNTKYQWVVNDELDFINRRIEGVISNYAVEYIFHKDLYLKHHGFKVYPLAWNSDDATYTTFMIDVGLKCIENSTVFWRYSGSNISSLNKDRTIIKKKILANILHLRFLIRSQIVDTEKLICFFFKHNRQYITKLAHKDFIEICSIIYCQLTSSPLTPKSKKLNIAYNLVSLFPHYYFNLFFRH